jgi:hypothetical protein
MKGASSRGSSYRTSELLHASLAAATTAEMASEGVITAIGFIFGSS